MSDMDRFRYLLERSLFILSFLLPGILLADVEITGVDYRAFPEMEVTVEIPSSAEGEPTFVVYEDYGSGSQAQNLDTVVSAQENGSNWVVVLDATKSVPKKDFLRSRKAALEFVRNLPDADRVAVYRINGKPVQILSMTGLSTERARVLAGIEGIDRTGMKTRIYDALYVGLDHATQARDAYSPRGSGLILFTDGRDEGSYLSEEDAIAIAGEARDAKIPVYTILNGKARGEERFQKIALKTGGEVFKGNFPPGRLKPSSESRSHFTLKYKSAAEIWNRYPGKEIKVRVEYLNEPDRFAEYTYKVPFRFLDGKDSLAWILVGLGLLLLIAFFVFLWIVLRRAQARKRLPPVSDEVMEGWSADHEKPTRLEAQPPGQITDFTEALARSQNPEGMPTSVSESVPGDQAGPDSYPVESAQSEAGQKAAATALASDDAMARIYQSEMPFRTRSPETISLELKEKSYQVLQMALRDASRYEYATLVLVGGDPYRQRNEYDLFLEETYIGRSPMASLVVADKSASMLHGKVRKIDQKYVLFDLVSDTGTYLNGKRVLRPRPLRNGDEIQIGHTRFEFRGKSI
ncbi:MAG: VWA domain-containing protein [Leptospiraceae bacterium]